MLYNILQLRQDRSINNDFFSCRKIMRAITKNGYQEFLVGVSKDSAMILRVLLMFLSFENYLGNGKFH